MFFLFFDIIGGMKDRYLNANYLESFCNLIGICFVTISQILFNNVRFSFIIKRIIVNMHVCIEEDFHN